MKITIFGATGGTGKELVKQAIERGHEINALVRDPQKLSVSDQRADEEKQLRKIEFEG